MNGLICRITVQNSKISTIYGPFQAPGMTNIINPFPNVKNNWKDARYFEGLEICQTAKSY